MEPPSNPENAGNENAGQDDPSLVVSKEDHSMSDARIYRREKRPNLYHYRDDYYDHEAGHYAIIDEATIRAAFYEFLDHCGKEVQCKGKPAVVSFAPNKSKRQRIKARRSKLLAMWCRHLSNPIGSTVSGAQL